MPLSNRQQIAYTHHCDLWEPVTANHPTTGRRETKSYVLRETGVRCRFKYRQNVEHTEPFGRAESDDFYSRDAVLFEEAQVIDSDWIVVNKSYDRDGNAVQQYGRGLMVMGQPQSTSDDGNREAGRRKVEGASIAADKLPSGVS